MTHPPPFGAEIPLEWARRVLRRLLWLMAVANVAVPLGLFLYAAAIDEAYWWAFWGEGNLITWFSSVQLLVVAAMAYLHHVLGRTLARRGDVEGGGNRWIWLVFAVGFVYLSIDEQFALHEAIRDGFLIPNGMFSGIPMVRPGDVGMYFYLLVGLVLTSFLLKELLRRRLAVVTFACGLVLIASTTFVDSLPTEVEERISYFWTSAYEETGECWAQLLFLVSFWLVLDLRLARLAGETVEVRPSRSGAGGSP